MKQTPRQRKALRSAGKKGSLRRETPAHPSPAAMPASTTLSLVNFSNDAGELTAQCWMTPEQIAVWSGLDVLTRPKPKTPPTNEMGAEARSAEPVQSDPPNFLHRLWSKIAGR